jgi:hypothetical protein
MYALMDRNIFIRAREQDYGLAEKAAKEAAVEFEKNTGFSVTTEIDNDSPLGADRYFAYQ